MVNDWLNSLDLETREKAQQMIQRLKALGTPNAEAWVQSEIQENIPQTARFLVLRRLWQHIDECRDGAADYIPRLIANADKHPNEPFADADIALKRIVDAGAQAADIGAF